MDLLLTSRAARRAVIFLLNCIAAGSILWVTSSYGSVSKPVKDYLSREEIKGGWISRPSNLQSSGSKSTQSTAIQYTAFDGQVYSLNENRGRHVNVLLPSAFAAGPFFTPDHVEELVDRLDILYVLYTELLGVEPSGSGLLNIAFVPQTCGMGCGLIGHKGIEILSDSWNYESIIRELDSGKLETILLHEMVHNFDTYSDHLHYLPDHAHAWTDMFEYFAPYRYARISRNDESPDDLYNSPVRSVWKDYVSNEAADWETCVRDQACEEQGLTANNLWAMLYYRIETLHGVGALLDSFDFISAYTRSRVPPESDEEKEGLRILSLAVGVGANIACYMDALKWPVPHDTRTELILRFGDNDEFCTDADQDGFSAINGDCDDQDASRNFLAAEITGNGKDDDCDDLVDEFHVVESERGPAADNFKNPVSAQLPFEVEGSIATSGDTDEFRFPLTSTTRARITLCADDEFEGWAVGLQPDGSFLQAANWNTYRPGAGCSSSTFDYQSFAAGGLVVMPDESAGAYSLTVSEAASLADESSAYVHVKNRFTGGVSIEFKDVDNEIAKLGADEIEFWISGVGLQIFRPFASNIAVSLAPSQYPQLVDGNIYQVRIRPRAGGLPLAGFSASRAFKFGKQAQPAAIDDQYSGAWFDPDHEGEGFVIEMLDQARAVVYWFTYHSDGRQRWMIGTGDVQENRITFNTMMDSSGGRFGSDFDPADVRLQHAGSLSITFNSCSEAVANYIIDGVGGHQVLGRLTRVYGHDCSKTDSPPDNDLSGSWYDPAHEGEGFVLEQLTAESAAVFWFTYDENGDQTWLLNTGVVEDSTISFPNTMQPVGGVFGRSFDPATVERRNWGDLTIELDCDGGKATYQARSDGYSNGMQYLVPLTRLANSGCNH